MRKYLLVTPSYNRPYMIRQCICNAKNQTYKNFIHSIAIQREEETNYNILYDDIIDNRWVINYYKKPDLDWPRSIHENHKNADFNVYSFKLRNLLNNYHLESGDYRNLGGVPEEYGMPMTLVFDKNAMNSLLLLNKEKEDVLWEKYNGADDTIWANYWKDIGLKIKPCTATDNLIWHIHGKNVSTSQWLKN